MINLELPERLQQLREQVHMGAEFMLRPHSRKYDDNQHNRPEEVFELSKLVEQGGAGSAPKSKKDSASDAAPKNKNGGNLLTVTAVEELSWGDIGLMLSMPAFGLGNAAIAAVGTPDQKKRFGDKFAAMAITEPGAGSDSKNISTTARRDGDEWVLNGEKIYVTAGDLSECVVVWATTDKSSGKGGIKSFLIEKGTPGFTLARLERKLGLRASDTAAFILEDCRIPLENILGGMPKEEAEDEEAPASTKGFGGVMQTFDNTRPAVAAMAVGVARAALELTKEILAKEGIEPNYDKPRFLSSALEAELYTMEADLEAARLLVQKAAWMADNGQPNSTYASMSKAKAGRTGNYVTLRCVELCQSLGYSEANLLEKFARDSKILDIFEGTQQIQKLIIARQVLGKSSSELK
ncbi:MAG: acyl-CoA dehydrogenase family protein [Pseudomonadota bacterium]